MGEADELNPEQVPYNFIKYLLAYCSLLDPQWGILPLGRFGTDRAQRGSYYQYIGTIFPGRARSPYSVSKRLVCFFCVL